MKNIRQLLQQARYQMWEEPTNSVGSGANVALPPAHEPPGIPASKKKKKYDGRTKAGRKLVSRILSHRDKKAKKKNYDQHGTTYIYSLYTAHCLHVSWAWLSCWLLVYHQRLLSTMSIAVFTCEPSFLPPPTPTMRQSWL